jgi:hypothetical protein
MGFVTGSDTGDRDAFDPFSMGASSPSLMRSPSRGVSGGALIRGRGASAGSVEIVYAPSGSAGASAYAGGRGESHGGGDARGVSAVDDSGGAQHSSHAASAALAPSHSSREAPRRRAAASAADSASLAARGGGGGRSAAARGADGAGAGAQPRRPRDKSELGRMLLSFGDPVVVAQAKRAGAIPPALLALAENDKSVADFLISVRARASAARSRPSSTPDPYPGAHPHAAPLSTDGSDSSG